MLNNSSHNSENEKEESNEEEVDYFIDTITNSKESLNNSETSEKIDDIESMSNKNQKNNFSKDKYIKRLEQKIKEQKEQISKLIAFKNKYEAKIKQMNPSISFPNKEKIKSNNLNNDINLDDITNSNRHNMSFNPSKIKDLKKEQILKLIAFKNKYEAKIKQMNPLISFPKKEKIKYNNLNNDINLGDITNSNRHNLSFNPSKIKDKKKEQVLPKLNKAKSELDIMQYLSSSNEDKYDKLYSKYLKIINDYKNLSNNSVSTNEYSKLKSQYNDLKNKNNNLLKEIQNERIRRGGISENKIIKDLKDQVETFRKELVLSQAMVNSLRAELDQLNKIRTNDNENGPDYINDMNNNNNFNDNINDDINYVDSDGNRKINFKYNNDQNDLGGDNLYNDNNFLKKENEELKLSLKNNNLLLSKVLEENNRLREENLNNQNIDNMNNINNMNNMNGFEDEIADLKNNLNQYEDKFDYFNEYINNIKLQIKNIFNDLLSIINKYDSPYTSKKNTDEFKNKLKDLKNKIDNIKEIDRFNLDSTDDEKCLQSYMNLVKILLNELENKQIINNNINKNVNKIRNDNLNNRNDKDDNAKRQLIDLIEVIKKIIKDNGTKQLISDAVNIINNLSNLYKLRNGNDPVENEKINKEIRELEDELEYIKKLLLNQRNNSSTNLTYEMHYNGQKVENGNMNKNEYYFQYD